MVLAVVVAALTYAQIVIVLPSYVTRDAASNYPAVAQRLRGTAEILGVQVIDSLAQRWYRNGDGNAYCTNKIMENLTRTGAVS